ncbi:MAG: 30S ribosomal protein S4e [Candidatus Atabeyarchaeum deiterrae]
MARKGPRKHLKRLAAPRDWRISRHEHYWAVRPRCGPHPLEKSMPLLNIVRETSTPPYAAREAKRALFEGKVLVDGVIRRDHKLPIGLMDVISIPATGKVFRVLPFERRGLGLHPIDKSESGFKLCHLINKTIVKGGNIQLNLHDGRNIIVKKNEAGEEFANIRTHDTLKIELPTQKIMNVVKFEIGTIVLISDGKNIGLSGRIDEIRKPKGTSLVTNVVVKNDEGTEIEVPLNYAFAIGKEQALISYPKSQHSEAGA